MNNRRHLLMFAVVLLPAGVAAQGVQNKDISFLFGATATGNHAIAAGAATVYGYTAPCASFRYGYQLTRVSFTSVWLDAGIGTFVTDAWGEGSLPGSTLNDIQAYTAGARFMVPVNSRVSLYGALGAGGGDFRHAYVSAGAEPHLASYSTWHGVFEFGGGMDYRIRQRISIRTEVRDFVSGRGLSGSAGRHHILPFAGVSFHF